MATEMLQYLDPDGLDETVLNIGQIKTSLEGQISDLGESIEEEMQDLPYARPDGIYPDMTVGAVIGADSTAQWATRESTGSGAATVRSVQGAAVVWNQLCINDGSNDTHNGLTATNNGDGSWTLDGTPTAQAGITIMSTEAFTAGHKLLVKGCPSGGGRDTYFFYFFNIGVDLGDGGIYTVSSATQGNLRFIAKVGTSFDNVTIWPQIFDLTQMFGSGNEPATVAEFEKMYPEPYYPYSAPTLKPVTIAGIASTDAQGGELDAIEWTAQELWGAGGTYDTLTSTELVKWFNGSVDLGTLNWSTTTTDTEGVYRLAAGGIGNVVFFPTSSSEVAAICAAPFTTGSNGDTYTRKDKTIALTPNTGSVVVYDSSYNQQDDAAAFKAAMSGVILHYATKEPIVTPISPALDMTYKVQAGGSESIIVPDGEVSAAPVITIAEPVNAGDEFARIWAAIQSLIDTRNTAQLSRPVSLTDIDNIDEVQKDTADVVEIDTTKEVQE